MQDAYLQPLFNTIFLSDTMLLIFNPFQIHPYQPQHISPHPLWQEQGAGRKRNLSLKKMLVPETFGIPGAWLRLEAPIRIFMILSSLSQVLLHADQEEEVGEANWCCKQALKGNVFLRQEIVYKLHRSDIYIKQSLCSLPSIFIYSLKQVPAGLGKPLFSGPCARLSLQREGF